MSTRRTVLVVEDHDAIRELVSQYLESVGYRCLSASSVSEARRLVGLAGSIEAAVVDLMMPEEAACGLAHELASSGTAVIVVTGMKADTARQFCPGGTPILEKPAAFWQIEEHLRRQLRAVRPVE